MYAMLCVGLTVALWQRQDTLVSKQWSKDNRGCLVRAFSSLYLWDDKMGKIQCTMMSSDTSESVLSLADRFNKPWSSGMICVRLYMYVWLTSSRYLPQLLPQRVIGQCDWRRRTQMVNWLRDTNGRRPAISEWRISSSTLRYDQRWLTSSPFSIIQTEEKKHRWDCEKLRLSQISSHNWQNKKDSVHICRQTVAPRRWRGVAAADWRWRHGYVRLEAHRLPSRDAVDRAD